METNLDLCRQLNMSLFQVMHATGYFAGFRPHSPASGLIRGLRQVIDAIDPNSKLQPLGFAAMQHVAKADGPDGAMPEWMFTQWQETGKNPFVRRLPPL